MRACTLSTVISSDMNHLVSRATDPGPLEPGEGDPGPILFAANSMLGPGSGATRSAGTRVTSRRHHHLADDLAILDQPQALTRLLERQHLVDHRLHLALLDQVHQALEVLVVEAVRADDLELEAPHITQVLFRVVAGGRPAHQQLAAALEAAQRRIPGLPTGEVDDDIDAAVVAAALRLAVFLDRPFRPVGLGVVDHLVGAHRLQPRELLVARRAGDDMRAEKLSEDHAAGTDTAGGAEHNHALALLDGLV